MRSIYKLSEFLFCLNRQLKMSRTKNVPKTKDTALLKGLQFHTFRMEISKRQGKTWAKVTRKGKQFYPDIMLADIIDANQTLWLQIASVIIEVVAMLLAAIGFVVASNETAVREATEAITGYLNRGSEIVNSFLDFAEEFSSASGSMAKANALFILCCTMYKDGPELLWTALRTLLSQLTWYQRVLSIARVIALIVAMVATDGAALVMRVATVIMDAVDLVIKARNLVEIKRHRDHLPM